MIGAEDHLKPLKTLPRSAWPAAIHLCQGISTINMHQVIFKLSFSFQLKLNLRRLTAPPISWLKGRLVAEEVGAAWGAGKNTNCVKRRTKKKKY